MAFTVGKIPIRSGVAHLPSQGVWSLRAELSGAQLPPAGRVEVVLGDLVLTGTLTLRPAVVAGRAEVHVVGGAAAWGSQVDRRPYRNDAGVLLRDVAADLAVEVGEELVVEAGVAGVVLGYGWTRPAGAAVEALAELGQPWWVDLAGVTHVGPRPTVQRSARLVLADPYTLSARRATILSPDDAFAAVQPGSTVTIDGTTLAIEACTILVDESGARAVVQASAAERWGTLLEAVLERGRRTARAAAVQTGRILVQVAGRITVQAQPSAGATRQPDQELLPVAYGLQGVQQLVRFGEGVLVAHQGGDPGAPVVTSFLGTAPALRTTIDATQGIRLAPSLDPSETVDVGGGTRGVAYGDSLALWAEKAHALLTALGVAEFGPANTLVTEELAAYNQSVSDGWQSDTLRTR